MLAAAVFFALESAILAVLLEWFFPIRSWKTESDLWHHPRKYVVPGILLSLAVLVGAQPGILPVLLAALALEAAVLQVLCRLGEPLRPGAPPPGPGPPETPAGRKRAGLCRRHG